MKKRDRILIVGPNWMGDMLFMTPAIRAIRKAYPESRIAALVPPRGTDLLARNPNLNEVIPWQESRGPAGLTHWFSLTARIRAGRFDTVFLFHKSASRAAMAALAGIPARIGERNWKRSFLLTASVPPAAKDSISKSESFLRVIEADGVPADGRQYEVGLSPEDHFAAETLLKEWGITNGERLVALHAGANWRLKRWPAESFARLGDELSRRFGARVLFIGGTGDLPLVEKILSGMKSRPLVAAGKTTFRELGALLTRARLLVSNDSGPLHLGIAVGTPVIALFGPTSPELTGPPPGSNAVTLVGSIGCPVPCYQQRCPANLCMSQISVEQVAQAAEKFLR